MLIPLPRLVELYRRIQEDASPVKSSVVILAAADVDSMAALRILTNLLQEDCIQYSVVPMHNYSQLARQLQGLERQQTTVRSVVCLNCGATTDMTQTWPAQHGVNCYIFDCHRPIFHTNAHHPRVFLISDGADKNLDNLPAPGEFEANAEESLEAILSEESEAEDVEEQTSRKRRREEQEERIQKRIKIETYYSGIYFGVSTAWLMFELAKQVNKANNDMLWMALVGVTEQFVHLKIDKFQYEQRCRDIQHDVVGLNDKPANQDPEEEENKLPEIGKVQTELKELRVMLLRHWNLYDSLYYSNTIASKLGTWKQQGRDKFHMILVKIGIPIKDSQQLYKFMANKSQFNNKALEVLREFKLDELFCTSYVRHYDLLTQFSCSDVVYATAALLECPEVVEHGEEGIDRSFWEAFDALTNQDLLLKGVDLAINLHKAIFALGTSLIEKKAINPTNDFRYAIVNNDTWEQSRFFHYPHALKRLCLFLMEAYKEQRSSIKPKPMVLSMLNSKRGVYLVTGIMDYDSSRSKNIFRSRFDEAVEVTKAEHRTDFFEGELIEVTRDNFQAFIDALTNERDSGQGY